MKQVSWLIILFFGMGVRHAVAMPGFDAGSPVLQSKGSLSFKYNGKLVLADPSHARAYAVSTIKMGYLNGANAENMILDVQAKGLYQPGPLVVHSSERCIVTLDHVDYSIRTPEDFFHIQVTDVRQEGQMLLMSGTFQGKLHDKKGNQVLITEGQFKTLQL